LTGHDIPVIAFPIANHDDNQHAANENFRLQNLWDNIEVFAAFFGNLGTGIIPRANARSRQKLNRHLS